MTPAVQLTTLQDADAGYCEGRLWDKRVPSAHPSKSEGWGNHAESDKMTLPAVVKTRRSPWHVDNVACSPAKSVTREHGQLSITADT